MTIEDRLQQWTHQGSISPAQATQITSLVRQTPFSIFLELNLLLYLGVLAFITGLGWTITTWSQQLGDIAILTLLCALLAGCFWFCFSRVPAWSRTENPAYTPVVDYVLYLGCLVWCLTLAYLERRFHLLTGQWDVYFLLTAAVFFFLAYRFDNRFVLSLALSSLAGWFGLTLSHLPSYQDAPYRLYALLFCLVVALGGTLLRQLKLKTHFFNTYLNIAANVLFLAVLSGVFEHQDYGLWLLGLVLAGAASLTWGIKQRQFVFIAYVAVYGYIGISDLLIRNINALAVILAYFVLTATAMIAMLVLIARRFGRDA